MNGTPQRKDHALGLRVFAAAVLAASSSSRCSSYLRALFTLAPLRRDGKNVGKAILRKLAVRAHASLRFTSHPGG